MDDKIIVSNRTALATKYGKAGLAKVETAVAALIAADKARGIKSRVIYLDNAAAMKKVKGKAVTAAGSPRQNKEAIDAVFHTTNPDYLMILGAPDVVPHQDLTNPAFTKGDDEDDDRFAYGDVPYACDAGYSQDARKFKGPTRVVGRLPDLRGAREPSYLVKVLRIASHYRPRKVTDYARYFAMSTQTWKESTAESLFNIFGNSDAMLLSPPTVPPLPAKKLAALSHFINCHGGPSDPGFAGEARNGTQVESMSSDSIAKKIKEGTVAAVECCYGAELYDSVTLALPLPICQRYLVQGAYGYFGSSTTAYGLEKGNGAADLITQFFLLAVLDGASLGRATLMARQRYVASVSEMDPMDLKTLAQFSLLGDPSVQPARVVESTSVPKGADREDAERDMRKDRRAKLRVQGKFLDATTPTCGRQEKAPRKSATVRTALRNIARQAGLGGKKEFAAYGVKRPPAGRAGNSKAKPMVTRYFVAVGTPKGRRNDRWRSGVAAVAREVNGRIVGYRIYTQR
jgi:Peptidase family C25